MQKNIPEINKNLSTMSDEDVKVTYVLAIMVRHSKIAAQDKAYIKQGLISNDPNFKMLRQLISLKNDYESISNYVIMFLQSQKQESPEENPQDFSPVTLGLLENANEDSSPIGRMMIHRKVKQQMNHLEEKELTLMGNLE